MSSHQREWLAVKTVAEREARVQCMSSRQWEQLAVETIEEKEVQPKYAREGEEWIKINHL